MRPDDIDDNSIDTSVITPPQIGIFQPENDLLQVGVELRNLRKVSEDIYTIYSRLSHLCANSMPSRLLVLVMHWLAVTNRSRLSETEPK